MQHSRSSRATVGAAAVSISASSLAEIRATLEAGGGRTRPAPASVPAAPSRERLQALDAARLKQRVESGATDTEAVAALAKQLGRDVANTRPGQRILAAERNGLVVVELDKQLQAKAARLASERASAAVAHEALVAGIAASARVDAERAAARAEQRREVQRNLALQLEERAAARVEAEEAAALEGELIVKAAKRDAEAEAAAAAARREAARSTALSTMSANESFKERDAARRAREEDADREVLRYILERDARSKAAEERVKAERAAAALLVAKLQADATRVADTRAAEDEAKGRAYEEKRILADREKERQAVAARARARTEAAESLQVQVALNAQRAADEAAKEAALLRDTAAAAAAAAERDDAIKEAKRLAGARAGAELAAQRSELAAQRALAAQQPLEERRRLRLVEAAQALAVETHRAEVLQRIQAASLPATFVRGARKVPANVL